MMLSEELSWFVRFFPTVIALSGSSPTNQRLIRSSWKKLGHPAILESRHKSSVFSNASANVKRIALVLDNDSDDRVSKASALKKALLDSFPKYDVFLIFLEVNDPSLYSSASNISLHSKTVKDRVQLLRSYKFDALLDTVGPHDPNWLLSVSQGVASLQLACFSSPFSIPVQSSYHGQIADRWTSPDVSSTYDLPLLRLSGIRYLSPPSYPHFDQIYSH